MNVDELRQGVRDAAHTYLRTEVINGYGDYLEVSKRELLMMLESCSEEKEVKAHWGTARGTEMMLFLD